MKNAVAENARATEPDALPAEINKELEQLQIAAVGESELPAAGVVSREERGERAVHYQCIKGPVAGEDVLAAVRRSLELMGFAGRMMCTAIPSTPPCG